MEKIYKYISENPDKILHFFGGLFIAQFMFYIPYINIYSIVFFVALIGFAKETIDYYRNTEFNFIDFIFTVIGGITGFLLFLPLYLIIIK